MSLRRVGGRLMLVLAAALAAGCTVPPTASGSDDAAASPPSERSGWPRLRPLEKKPAAPPGAAPQSAVAAVNYDILVSGTGEASDDRVPGDTGPREVFERGGASWYGIEFHLRKTANGERFDMSAMTAAHKTLPFGTKVCVRSLVNGKEVLVRINDRGPYAAGRIIDLSRAAADQIGLTSLGIKQVSLSVIDRKDQRCGGVSDVPGATDPSIEPEAPAQSKVPRRSSARQRK
jgi:rare lipoprotein A